MAKNIKALIRKTTKYITVYQEQIKRIGIALGVLLIGALGIFGLPGEKYLSAEAGDTYAHAQEEGAEESPDDQLLCVYICGQVQQPGVYYVSRGARVCDVVEKAQGLTGDAALETLNLAREVKDGEQIIVRSVNETSYSSADGSSNGPLLININGATSEQLQQLPGVGPSLAQKIISYRNAQGAFTCVDDLKNVSGIGDKKLDSIREYVCV